MIRKRGGMIRSCRLGLGRDWNNRRREGGGRRGLYRMSQGGGVGFVDIRSLRRR